MRWGLSQCSELSWLRMMILGRSIVSIDTLDVEVHFEWGDILVSSP